MVAAAVDDRYIGCRDKAFEKFIKGGLVYEDLKLNAGFAKALQSSEMCFKLKPETTKYYLAALTASKNDEEVSIEAFNKAVETLGADAKIYEDQFKLKSFHFLLMDSMRERQPTDCKTAYAIMPNKYESTKGSRIRLGRFVKAYFNFKVLEETDLDGMLIFNITSCFFADLGANICSKEDAILLSPAEVFTVEDLVKITGQDDTTYQLMTVKHAELFSYHNCYIFSR